MSTVPKRYQPTQRLIDDRELLDRLYNERELTIEEIANNYAEVGTTRVYEALREHGLTDTTTERGTDPPDNTVNWSSLPSSTGPQ